MSNKQEKQILDYIKNRGSISSREAFLFLGITRLSARIYDLRDRGYNIKSEWESYKTEDGATVRYAVYRFADDGGKNNEC